MPGDLGVCSSFGATGPLETALGLLSITVLMAARARRVRAASLRPPAEPALFGPGWRETVIARNHHYMKAIAFEDVSVTDDQGASYVLRTREKAGFPVSMLRPTRTAVDLVLELEPLPPPGRVWFELSSPAGSPIRLVAGDRAVPPGGGSVPLPGTAAERDLSLLAMTLIEGELRRQAGVEEQCAWALARAAEAMRSGELAATSELPGQLAALSAALTADRVLAADRPDGLPPGWSGMIAAARRSDGPPLQLDIAAALPVVNDTAVQVDTLISQPGSWRVYLRASPPWLRRGHDPPSFRPVMTVHAEDDRGGSYLAGPAGERHHYPIGAAGQDAVEVVIKLWPRLDPLARALTLTFEGPSEQVTLDVAW